MPLNFIKHYPFSILIVICVVLLSVCPIGAPDMTKNVPLADKWTHMVMYGALTLVIWFDYKGAHKQLNSGKLLLFAFLAPIAMGGLLELAQAYLTTCRSGDWMDFAANSIGVCIGTVCGLIIKR